MSTRKRVGIMGGTFDPIHIGHLIIGECAWQQLYLDQVLFMPSGNPPHKTDRAGGASNEQRVEMVRQAIAGNEHFALSLVEMHEMGYIYTSKTLTTLTEENPDTDYYFIMGADSLMDFEHWKDPQIICDKCALAVAVREHMSMARLEEQIRRISDLFGARIYRLITENIDISSHQIRSWMHSGRSCRYYLPDPVLEYIEEQKLYL